MFNLDWLRVKKLVCLACEERFGREEATFNRDGTDRAFVLKSHLCPRCGGTNTLPEMEIVMPGEEPGQQGAPDR